MVSFSRYSSWRQDSITMQGPISNKPSLVESWSLKSQSSGLWSHSTVNGLLRTYMCWTSGKWIQWPVVPFLCWHTWSQCLWGSCWQRQLAGLPGVDKHPVLFGRHQPVLPWASFCHSIWVAWKLFWQLSPLSSVNCHFHFIPVEDHILLQHCPEWLHVMWEMWYKVHHVCHHANETGQLLLFYGWCYLYGTLDLLRTGVHVMNCILLWRKKLLATSVLVSYCSRQGLQAGRYSASLWGWHHCLPHRCHR